jgi:hypothetical protein
MRKTIRLADCGTCPPTAKLLVSQIMKMKPQPACSVFPEFAGFRPGSFRSRTLRGGSCGWEWAFLPIEYTRVIPATAGSSCSCYTELFPVLAASYCGVMTGCGRFGLWGHSMDQIEAVQLTSIRWSGSSSAEHDWVGEGAGRVAERRSSAELYIGSAGCFLFPAWPGDDSILQSGGTS